MHPKAAEWYPMLPLEPDEGARRPLGINPDCDRSVDTPRADECIEWLCVTETAGDRGFEARFELRLVGASVGRQQQRFDVEGGQSGAAAFDLPMLVRCTACLPVCVEIRATPEMPTLDWLLSGSIKNASKEGAIVRGSSMMANLLGVVGRPDADYLFAPSKIEEWQPDSEGVQTIRLARPSVVLSSSRATTLGFGDRRRRATSGRVRAPLFAAWGGISRTVRALSSASDSVRVRFRVSSVWLSPQEITTLIQARGWLVGPTPKGFTYAGLAGAPAPADPILFPELDRQLATWIRHPRGFRVECELLAHNHARPAVLAALEHDFNGLRPVADELADDHPEESLDISPLAHEAVSFPSLFPDRSVLFELGIRRTLANGYRRQDAGSVIGRFPGPTRSFARLPQRSRDRHCYVIGATGTGKSTLLYNLIVQNLAAGDGVCLIDPHGELFDWVLHAVPASRADDVRIIDPYDPDFVVGLNPLECLGPHRRWQMQTTVSEFIRIIDHLYDLEEKGGPMFELYMRNAMFLVMDDPGHGGTLLDVVRVFEDREYRRLLLATCSDASVVDFWTKQAERATGESSLAAMTPYITSKLNQFSQNALLAPIVGQRANTFAFSELLDRKGILLANLSIGRLGVRDAQLLGMLLVGGLLRAALGRGPLRHGADRLVHVYLDEFQYFLTEATADTLAQGRKFGLALTMAHQHVGQLTTGGVRFGTKLLEAVLGNAATKLLFRVGPGDVDRLQGWVQPDLDGRDLLRLGNHDLVACLAGDPQPVQPMIVETLPMMNCPYKPADSAELRDRQRNYARPRADAEAQVFRTTPASSRPDAAAVSENELTGA